jgi:hypothetical protein
MRLPILELDCSVSEIDIGILHLESGIYDCKSVYIRKSHLSIKQNEEIQALFMVVFP